MKTSVFFFTCFLIFQGFAQGLPNTTPTYDELIETYRKMAAQHDEIQLFQMGNSDYGMPIYLCVVNGGKDSLQTFEKARKNTTILVNNGIHPGEPDGINACLLWVEEWIKRGKKTENLPVIAIIPAYNVGGMHVRSSSSRANQDGPEEYGFRGNAQNLDLNRDFIKMDSKNAFTFAHIFHALDPDVFIDTHVSNGADYQYVLTYIASVRERMAPSMGSLVHDQFLPYLYTTLTQRGTEPIPYVNLIEDVPEKGMVLFDDLPRYAMGYAALFHSMSFTVETHMLKNFPSRTQATLNFLEATVAWTCDHKETIEDARTAAFAYDQSLKHFALNYELSEQIDSIRFKGFEHTYPISEVTGLPRLKYHRDRPFDKNIPFKKYYVATDSVQIPEYYIIGGQCSDILDRLAANGVEMEKITSAESRTLTEMHVLGFESPKHPYEGHFLHDQIKTDQREKTVMLKPGDIKIATNQRNRRFILSVLEPTAPDSYFAWNFMDSYVQQKEYFSSYVFEDYALEMLNTNPELKIIFEQKKQLDPTFASSSWAQLYFLYCHSKFYEPSHNVLPVFKKM